MNKKITATGQVDLELTDPQIIGAVVFNLAISGGGTFSLIPQYQKRGVSTYENVPYSSVGGTAYTAGAAITQTGVGTYEAQADSGLISLIVSAVTGTLTVTYDCVAGAGGSAGSGGGGGSTAVTIADGADAALGTTTDAAVVNPASAATLIAAVKGTNTILQATPTAPAPVAGWIAEGAAASGENPVYLAGKDVAGNLQGLPMVTNADALTATTQKAVMTKSLVGVLELTDIVGVNSVHKNNADGVSNGNAMAVGTWVYDTVTGSWDRSQLPNADNTNPTGVVGVCELLYNGTTGRYDRRRNNNDVLGLASAARTATTSTPDQVSYNFQGLIVGVNVTALTATGTLTVTIEGKDAISSTYYTLFTGTAIAATGFFPYQWYPGAATTSGVSGPGRVPRTFRVTVTHGNAVSITYSVNLSMLA